MVMVFSDYKDIDPMFGDLSSFDAMIEHAHQLRLKIIIDLVLSHTSDQHDWFLESCSNKDNQRHDWYVWADAKPDGGPPNNWLSIFGGPGWTWHSTRCQYYQHNFLSSQPDLNFHNLKVQDALLDVARFWLDRGVDGFRLDTINFYFSDAELRDNPALPPEKRNADIAPAVNPYNHQNHLYDKNRPENLAFLERLRALMDEYPAATAVGEIGDAQYGSQLLLDYTYGNKRMHMCYTFDFLNTTPPTAQASRWSETDELSVQQLKMFASMLMSMRGSVCLYQGEELGLPEAQIPFEKLQDPYGIAFWPKFKGRDGCRTPMVWDKREPNAGFSDSEAEPWLPIPDQHKSIAVAQQSGDPESVLEHYRQFIEFRRNCLPLIKGSLQNIEVQGELLSFQRTHENSTVFCAFNLGGESEQCTIDSDREPYLLDGHGFSQELTGSVLTVAAHSAGFVMLG